MLIHMGVALCAAAGLNGLAVGLGAVFPNMRSDDPSKIVSSFGGTLNLILSICFVITTVGLAAVPLHLYATERLHGGRFLLIAGLCLGLDLLLAAVACLVPMFCGQTAFERMEF
jgi:ABC-2 type transport system permease protein